jgi:uncharacterized protein YeaO (DUF488 family)
VYLARCERSAVCFSQLGLLSAQTKKRRKPSVCSRHNPLTVIKQASIYDPEPRDAFRVLVMRYWPRGVRRERVDLWLKDAAPSAQLLKAYAREGLPWAEFDQRYRAEITDERPHVLERLRDLEHEHGDLTLLCHERIPPAAHCHRQVLAELLSTEASGCS